MACNATESSSRRRSRTSGCRRSALTSTSRCRRQCWERTTSSSTDMTRAELGCHGVRGNVALLRRIPTPVDAWIGQTVGMGPEPKHPAIVVVDDDPPVLRAIRRDLGRRYRSRFRILAAPSGAEGLRVLDALDERREEAALFVVDQRMPEMQGIAFVSATIERFPRARRVLLTAYADTEVAISAINQVRLDHYLVKPWDPPEERLYPVLDELLADWAAGHRPPYGGIEVFGHRVAPATHRVRDFLTRHEQPFRFVDVGSGDERVARTADGAALPLVVLPNGTRLPAPGPADLTDALGLRVHSSQPYYDVVIVGAGPTGLAAAVYSSSGGVSTLLVDADVPRGAGRAARPGGNYLGFPSGG